MSRSKWPGVKEKLFLIQMWCQEGCLEKDIAKKLGISVSTLEEYKTKHPELVAALKKGKEIVDYEVQNSLYKKCVGCYTQEDRAFKCKEIYYDDQGRRCEREVVQTVKVEVFIPPDTTAIAIWLNNRNPEKWRRNANKEKLDRERLDHEKEISEKKYW